MFKKKIKMVVSELLTRIPLEFHLAQLQRAGTTKYGHHL